MRVTAGREDIAALVIAVVFALICLLLPVGW